MKTTKHFVLLVCLLSLILSLTLIATAEEIQPYALPTISSTTCSTCGTRMTYESTNYEYESVLVQPSACPNTSWMQNESLEPHWHTYKLRYDTYMCPSCSRWGRLFVSRTMSSCAAATKSVHGNY